VILHFAAEPSYMLIFTRLVKTARKVSCRLKNKSLLRKKNQKLSKYANDSVSQQRSKDIITMSTFFISQPGSVVSVDGFVVNVRHPDSRRPTSDVDGRCHYLGWASAVFVAKT